MKRILMLCLSLLMVSVSAIIFSIGCTFGINNSQQNKNNFLNGLLNNPYESLIIQSSGSVEDDLSEDNYHIQCESRIGNYSNKMDCNIESFGFEASLIKTAFYEEDKQFNSFGVLSSIVNGTRYLWDGLSDNSCFISRNLSQQYTQESGEKESELIGKTITIGSSSLVVVGVYYTNLGSKNADETKTKGNAFSLTFNDAIFVSESFQSKNIDFKSFLFLKKESKINSSEIYSGFFKATNNKKQTIFMNDSLGSYKFGTKTIERIDSVDSFYSSKENVLLCCFLLIVGIIIFLFAIVLLIKSRPENVLNKTFKGAVPLLPILIMTILLFVMKNLYLKTSMGVPITFNNPASICAISLAFFITTALIVGKVSKSFVKNYSLEIKRINVDCETITI